MVNPGGTGTPAFVISARPEPLPPRASFISPLPSAQLFEAAGLTGVRLWPFTLAFFGGRLVSYSIYAATAKQMGSGSLGDSFRQQLTSPLGIGLQLLMIGLLVALAQVDWAKRLNPNRVNGREAL